jgi:polyisoprenoid-binding protein YceI
MTIKRLLCAVLIPAALVGGAAGWISADLAPVRYAVAPTGNEARFKVREILMGREAPNDAVGVTSKVTGAIVIGDDGQPIAAQSKIVVDASDLKTDVSMRDGFIKRNTLQTEQYPTIEFVPTSFRGLTGPLPTSGSRSFQIVGNMKIRDTTRSIAWNVTAEFAPGRVTGSAATRFNFEDFEMSPPKAGRVFMVSSGVNLEYDFNLVAGNVAS